MAPTAHTEDIVTTQRNKLTMGRNLFLRTGNKVVEQSVGKDRARYVCVNVYVSKGTKGHQNNKKFKGIDKRVKEKNLMNSKN